MRILVKLAITAVLLTLAAPGPVRADDADAKVRKSVVKILSKLRRPDPYRPWTKGEEEETGGSGVVISGKRILTNSHVVNSAVQILVQPDKSSDKLSAKVEAIALGIDLAVLKLDDESFFESHPAIAVAPKLSSLQQSVFVYGYPEGGTELSITRGIVSRIEFAEYYLDTHGLRIQVDAAINPGNSGGPAVSDGHLIGIAFSRLQRSDNIGYIIPMEEIDLFIEDIKDGRYDGKPVLEIDIQNLENEALRSKLKLDKKSRGVLVRKINRSVASYPLQTGDVITRIGDHDIDNSGMVHVEGDHLIKFPYLIQRLTRNGRLPVTVLRDNHAVKQDLPVEPASPRLFQSLAEKPPSYFVFGPLVFTDVTVNYINSITSYATPFENTGSYSFSGLLYSKNPMYTRYGDRPSFPDERIVVIAYPMFTHKISKGYNVEYSAAVAEVNGIRIRNLKHMVEVIRGATEEFIEFTFQGKTTDAIVFNRKEALDATEEILNDNGIRQQCSPDIAPVWNQAKPK
jgi:S1-C subfamily serine protease